MEKTQQLKKMGNMEKREDDFILLNFYDFCHLILLSLVH